MTYDEALHLDLGERVESEGLVGRIIEISHKIDLRSGKRYLFFHIELDAADATWKTRGPIPAERIRSNLLQRMAEAADGHQAGEDGGVARR